MFILVLKVRNRSFYNFIHNSFILLNKNIDNLIPFATVKWTMGWVKDFDTMFITKEEEACINIWYDKVLDIYILIPIK